MSITIFFFKVSVLNKILHDKVVHILLFDIPEDAYNYSIFFL